MFKTSKHIIGFIRAWALGLALLATAGGAAHAAEIIFQPGPGLNDGSDNGSASAGKDAHGGDCFNPSANYGDSPHLYAGPQSNCNNCNTSAWIQFDVSTLPSNVISVHVGFAHQPHTVCYSGCEADFYFYPVTSDWNEMMVSRAMAPTRGAAMVGPIHLTAPNNYGTREYDITAMYQQWKADPASNHGFEISSPTVTCNNGSVAFFVASSDSTDPGQRPYLRIVTSDVPPPPAAVTPVPTLSEIGLLSLGLALGAVGWWRRRRS